MAREPNWNRLGFETASGTKKSSMNLPSDFFTLQYPQMFQDDFNVVKFANEYAMNWLETEQWRTEVGEKIQTFVKKYPNDDMKVDTYMEKAYQWVDGYADLILSEFLIFYNSTPPEIRSKLSGESVRHLVEQALSNRPKVITHGSNKTQ